MLSLQLYFLNPMVSGTAVSPLVSSVLSAAYFAV